MIAVILTTAIAFLTGVVTTVIGRIDKVDKSITHDAIMRRLVFAWRSSPKPIRRLIFTAQVLSAIAASIAISRELRESDKKDLEARQAQHDRRVADDERAAIAAKLSEANRQLETQSRNLAAAAERERIQMQLAAFSASVPMIESAEFLQEATRVSKEGTGTSPDRIEEVSAAALRACDDLHDATRNAGRFDEHVISRISALETRVRAVANEISTLLPPDTVKRLSVRFQERKKAVAIKLAEFRTALSFDSEVQGDADLRLAETALDTHLQSFEAASTAGDQRSSLRSALIRLSDIVKFSNVVAKQVHDLCIDRVDSNRPK